MSLSLAKKSMKLFDSQDELKDKHKRNKKAPKRKECLKNDRETKIRKLLMFKGCMDDELSRSLLKNATKTKRAAFKSEQETIPKVNDTSKAGDESIFSEEDFKNFEEAYKQIQNN